MGGVWTIRFRRYCGGFLFPPLPIAPITCEYGTFDVFAPKLGTVPIDEKLWLRPLGPLPHAGGMMGDSGGIVGGFAPGKGEKRTDFVDPVDGLEKRLLDLRDGCGLWKLLNPGLF